MKKKLSCLFVACSALLVPALAHGAPAPPAPPAPLAAPAADVSPAHGEYVDPTSGQPRPARILRPFYKPEHNWNAGHRGVDLELAVGAPVLAAGAGKVAFAGTVAGRPSVSIIHPDGLRTTYTPVFATVRVGETIEAGWPLGTLAPPFDGHRGLHWGALRGRDDYLNPLTLLPDPVIRLKTVRD